MKYKWKSSKYPGIRYREHHTRKHGIHPDKYYTIRYQHQGQRHEEGLGWASAGWSPLKAHSTLCELRHAAKIASGPTTLAERRAKERQRQRREKDKISQMTLDELFRRYKSSTEPDVKNFTGNYENRYKQHIHPILGNTPLKEITTEKIQKIKQRLTQKQLSPATIRHVLGVARQTINWGIDAELYKYRSPFSGLTAKKLIPRKLNNARLRILTKREEGQLLDKLNTKSPDTYDMTLMSLYSGLRWGEIAQLRWMDIDLDRNLINVNGKGDKECVVPLPDMLQQLLRNRKSLWQPIPPDLIWPSSRGKIRPQISKSFASVVSDIGLNEKIDDRRHRITFHSLRHTFATRLAEADTPLTILRDLLGHRDLTMVSRYAKSTHTQAAERVAELSHYFKDNQAE